MAGEPVKGKNLRLSFDGKTLYHATSCSMSISTNFATLASKDTEGEMSLPDNYTWNVSTSAIVANKPVGSTQADFMDIVDLHLDQVEVDIEFTTAITGDKVIKGKAFVESSAINAEVGNYASGDFSFKGNGNLTREIIA